jgi:hypothetical protein
MNQVGARSGSGHRKVSGADHIHRVGSSGVTLRRIDADHGAVND